MRRRSRSRCRAVDVDGRCGSRIREVDMADCGADRSYGISESTAANKATSIPAHKEDGVDRRSIFFRATEILQELNTVDKVRSRYQLVSHPPQLFSSRAAIPCRSCDIPLRLNWRRRERHWDQRASGTASDGHTGHPRKKTSSFHPPAPGLLCSSIRPSISRAPRDLCILLGRSRRITWKSV